MRKGIRTDWVIAKDSGATALCTRCGATQTVVLPMSIAAWCAAMNEFVKLHRGCKVKKDERAGT